MKVWDLLLGLAIGLVLAVITSELLALDWRRQPAGHPFDAAVERERWAVLLAAETIVREAAEDATG